MIKASKESGKVSTLGAWFDPFEEVKKNCLVVPTCPQDSLVRLKFSSPCETTINEEVKVECNAFYVYHTPYAYFGRDNIALKGFAKLCKESSTGGRKHTEKLMECRNKHGRKLLGTLKVHINGFHYSTFRPDECIKITNGNLQHAFFLAS